MVQRANMPQNLPKPVALNSKSLGREDEAPNSVRQHCYHPLRRSDLETAKQAADWCTFFPGTSETECLVSGPSGVARLPWTPPSALQKGLDLGNNKCMMNLRLGLRRLSSQDRPPAVPQAWMPSWILFGVGF